MEEIFKLLVNADTAMVAVTFAVCQIVKRMLPTPPPEIVGEPYNPWSTIKRLAWVPFAMAFIVGVFLSVAFALDYGQPLAMKVRAGLQTGAYSVAAWELWNNAKKLFGEK
jgi:hypothetical protein